jgi:arylsulfatase A-like enzyme
MFGTAEEYARQVRYVDVVLGRFLDALEAAGRLDSATVVVTSDHSWKKDPDKGELVRERLRRVPLVVKWPFPADPARVDAPICLLSLHTMTILRMDQSSSTPASCAAK